MQIPLDFFEQAQPQHEQIRPNVIVLRAYATPIENRLWTALQKIATLAPFRHMTTPNGFRMSVAMTNCGTVGWVTDKSGYRYAQIDPQSSQLWPKMPSSFLKLATDAANQAGFSDFIPDSCLINRYESGSKLSLHQDKDEQDFSAPIVSVSLGLPAIFLLGGLNRTDKPQRIPLFHGDVVVWGGSARLLYHGVMPLKEGLHTITGKYRFNLTFRKAT